MSLEILRKNFNEIRKNPETWSHFKYKDDETKINRYAIAKELQYNIQESDYDFIKFLMEEEIKCRKNDPFQGYSECLLLLSYLLASYKKPENVLIFEKAKLANFDTYCGYDERFIFSAGIKKTYDYLQKLVLNNSSNAYLFRNDKLIETTITDSDINDFFEKLKNILPKEIENENITSRISTVITLKEVKKFDVLYEELENTPNIEANTCAYYARLIGNYEKEIYYKNILFKNEKDRRRKINYLMEISEAYLNLNKPVEAYNVLLLIDDYFDLKEDIASVGSLITDSWFKISVELQDIGEIKLSKTAYEIANGLIWKINPPCRTIEDGILVVDLHGTDEEKEKYRMKLEKERIRINNLLGR